jgi:AcrR family transcriptional regulator
MRTKDENKRHAISHAAIELVYTEGLANTSMSKIAKKAGVSPSTIYVYFDNKDDMLNKLYLYAKEAFCSALMEHIDLSEALKTISRKIFDNFHAFTKSEPILFLFAEQFVNSPQLNFGTKESVDKLYTPLYNVLQRGVEESLLRPLHPGILGAVFLAPSMFLFKQMHDSGIKLNKQILDTVYDMAWAAIKR